MWKQLKKWFLLRRKSLECCLNMPFNEVITEINKKQTCAVAAEKN